MPDADLLDLTRMPLAELLSTRDTVLDEAVRKVVKAAEEQGDKKISAFNSALPGAQQ